MYCCFSFMWTDLILSPALLSHPLSQHISLSHTSHFSLNCIHFLTSSQLYFILALSFLFKSLSASLWHVFSSFTHFVITPSFDSFFNNLFLFSFLLILIDASLSGGVCSEYLKPQLPLLLRPTCPSCSMWRSQTLEPRFWAPSTSSACWDTTAMCPSWSKVG